MRVQLPAERVGNHRDRFGKADVAHAPVVDLLLELLAREAGADLLLERQPADARVLHAIDADRLHAFAHAGQRDRQRVHHEPRVHARAEHRNLGFFRELHGWPRAYFMLLLVG